MLAAAAAAGALGGPQSGEAPAPAVGTPRKSLSSTGTRPSDCSTARSGAKPVADADTPAPSGCGSTKGTSPRVPVALPCAPVALAALAGCDSALPDVWRDGCSHCRASTPLLTDECPSNGAGSSLACKCVRRASERVSHPGSTFAVTAGPSEAWAGCSRSKAAVSLVPPMLVPTASSAPTSVAAEVGKSYSSHIMPKRSSALRLVRSGDLSTAVVGGAVFTAPSTIAPRATRPKDALYVRRVLREGCR